MRFFSKTATAAVLTLFATVSTASADGWGDNTAYRDNGWNPANTRIRSITRDDDAPTRRASTQRRARVARDADDERPQQRRSRNTRTASLGNDWVGGGSAGGSTGMASFYWQPQRVASGGWFNPSAMTAAHKTLPFGTRVRVTHLGNGQSVTVTINDRGPYIAGRIIDLSRAAASAISMTGQGVARVRVTVLGR